MKRCLIALIAATMLSHRVEAQIETRTTAVPRIGTIIAPPPVVIATPFLKFTGTRFTPKSLATGKLVFTGWRWIPVTLNTNPIVFTGTRSKRLTGGLK